MTAHDSIKSYPRTIVVASKKDQHALFGTITLLTYVGIWVASVLSPILLLACWLWAPASVFGALLGLTMLAYAPGVPRSAWLARVLSKGSAQYHDESSILCESAEALSARSTLDNNTTTTSPNLLCVHPHGIFCQGWGMLFVRPELSSYHFCFADALYWSPYFRLLCRLVGKPASAGKHSFLQLMSRNRDIAVIPGGFEEAALHNHEQDRVFLKKRAGFVKMALQHGYSLVPCYVFGERLTYKNLSCGQSLRLWLSKYKIPAVAPWGVWWCPLLPIPTMLHTVIGQPLRLPHLPNPTREDVDKWHATYVSRLKDLFDRNKTKMSSDHYNKDVELHIM